VQEDPEKSQAAEPEINQSNISRKWIKSLLYLTGGITLLSLGSNLLVGGASSVAKILGVSEAVIGLTIVSAGTSMPELVTSLVAAIKGRTDLAIGNVVGSNLLNQLLVLSSSAIFTGSRGLAVEDLIIQRDIPVMLLATLALNPIFWSNGRISRNEGMILVTLYLFYLIDQLLPHTLPTWQDEFRLIVFCVILPIAIGLIAYETVQYSMLRKRENISS